jgi:hypothetical protein
MRVRLKVQECHHLGGPFGDLALLALPRRQPQRVG